MQRFLSRSAGCDSASSGGGPAVDRQTLGVVVAMLLWSAVPAIGAPQPPRILSPRDREVIQRREATSGRVAVVVESAAESGGEEGEGGVEARLATAPDAPWVPLERVGAGPGGTDGAGGTRRFEGLLGAPAGGWYRLEVRSMGAPAAEAVVERVGVGEVFLVAGQSNSANHGESRRAPASDLVSALAPDGTWRVAADPQPGASGDAGSFLPPLGELLVERFGVPVGFVACGIGATSVREWLPAGVPFPNPPTLVGRVKIRPDGSFESDGAAFAMLVERMKQCGPEGFRAVLWHQGESDANQAERSRTLAGPLYEAFLARLIADARRETGRDSPWFVARASYHVPGDEASVEIRAAQNAVCRDGLALAGPDTDLLGAPFRDGGGKGVHFSASGLVRHAEAWFEKVAPWLDRSLGARSP